MRERRLAGLLGEGCLDLKGRERERKNIEFLIGFLEAVLRDDRAAVRAALKPDIVWQGLRPDLVCHSADEVTDVFLANRDEHYREIDVVELIGAERHAILHAAGATALGARLTVESPRAAARSWPRCAAALGRPAPFPR